MTSLSESQTFEIAKMLVDQAGDDIGQRAVIFAISGPLGAGKTRLVKGLATALRIGDNVVSPTYVLETEYRIPNTEIKFAHLDAYRLETADELSRLGLENRVKNKCVIALEWADKFPHFLDQFAGVARIFNIKMSPGKAETEREINW